MKQTNSPSGAVVTDAAAASSELSQWLYLHTSLGKGYIAPFAYKPSWVITSGVPAELTRRMREAENCFHDAHEKSIASERTKLESLEHRAQSLKGPGYNGSPQAAADQAAIKDLKASLARPVFVNYRDWTADRATILELLSKSKFRAMSFVDEMGVRAHSYTTNKFLAAKHISNDLSLLSLVGDHSSDSVLIRSSATGGANMLSVRGHDSPRFNLMTLTTPQAAAKIASRLKEAAPCRGITLVLPTPSRELLAVPDDQIARVIAKVYATAVPDNRLTVQVTDAWTQFLACAPSDYSMTRSATARHEQSLCNIETLVHAVTRAVITRRIYLNEVDLSGPESPDRVVFLDDDVDLPLAKSWVTALMDEVTGVKFLQVRRDNAAKAREARSHRFEVGFDPATTEPMVQILVERINGSFDRMLTRTEATRIPGINPRLLDHILESRQDIFTTVSDHKRGKTYAAQAIGLLGQPLMAKRSGFEKVDDLKTPVGGDDTSPVSARFDESTLDDLYRTWQQQAFDNMQQGGKPVIALNDLSPALRLAVIAVQKRHWQTMTLVPSGPKDEDPSQLSRPAVELWFRYKPGGGDMCSWRDSYTEWQLAQKWQDKDEAAEATRQCAKSGDKIIFPALYNKSSDE